MIPRSDAQMLFEVWKKYLKYPFIVRNDFDLSLGQNLGESLKEEEIEGLLDEGDLEGDGSICYMDFCAIKNLM